QLYKVRQLHLPDAAAETANGRGVLGQCHRSVPFAGALLACLLRTCGPRSKALCFAAQGSSNAKGAARWGTRCPSLATSRVPGTLAAVPTACTWFPSDCGRYCRLFGRYERHTAARHSTRAGKIPPGL